ncbi:MAG: DUF4097 family beta strand repeat-containing protein [Acidobacteriaceae bacterium]
MVFCAAFAFAAPLFAQQWSKSFEVTGKPTVRVTADDARVSIKGCDCTQVQARVSWQGYKNENVRITPSQSGNTVSLEVRTREQHLVNFGWERRSVLIEVTVPKDLSLEVQTGDGSVQAAGVAGDLRFKTGDGSLDLTDLDGTLDAASGDGHIRASGRFDDLRLQTSDGHVDIDVRKGSSLKDSWSVRSGDGSVRMRLPDDLHANFEARTGDGSIHTDFPVTISGDLSERKHLEGKINGGGGLLTIRTADGSIYLNKN